MLNHKSTLFIIVLSQFFCTSLWFAGNAVMTQLIESFGLSENSVGHITSSVQFGFIIGTLCFAVLAIADRYSPSKVFFTSALLGAFFNLGVILEDNNFTSILLLRFLTGFFLAGIYPVGMKIAADYFQEGLGKSLGFLVGALVVGTAFPHLLMGINGVFQWQVIIIAISCLSILGGMLILSLIPDGPYRKQGKGVNLTAFFKVFSNRQFRVSAFGYFGHMWELYAFWAFVPLMLSTYSAQHVQQNFNVPLLSFLIIAIGGVACVVGGYVSQMLGTKRTATAALFLSCICCVLSPLLLITPWTILFILFMIIWGMVVVADSPLFSTMVARNAPPEIKGTALTIVNCIGFLITILSIQLLTAILQHSSSVYIYMILAAGPVAGLVALMKKEREFVDDSLPQSSQGDQSII